MNYADLLKTSPQHISSRLADDIVFSTRFTDVALQAADLLAYQCYLHIVRRIENGGQYVEPNYVLRQLRRSRNELKFINEDSVNRLLAGFHAQTGQGLRVKRGKKKQQFRVSDGQ